MIPKNKEDYLFVSGEGRPFEMPERYPIEKNDMERQRPIVVELNDLNGQDGGRGMPVNFVRRAGRTLSSFSNYWIPDDDVTDEEDYDIQ